MIKHQGNIEQGLKRLKNDQNNAVTFVYDEAKNQPNKLLSFATITIKDNYATKDAPTEASSKILKSFNTFYDATIVEKLKEAGGAILAKVNLDELSLGGTGTFSSKGVITNPLDKNRLIGGSSSGSAATFDKNISIAIGSDTGDSVRLPASYIGQVGFKPSYGAISRYGLFSFASSLDTVAYFTHNVNDAIITSQVLFGKDEKDMRTTEVKKPISTILKPKTIAFLKNTNILSNDVKREYEALKEKLIQEDIKINEYMFEQELLDAIDIVYSIISFSEASSNNANLNGVAFGNQQEGKDWLEIMTNTRTQCFGEMVQRRFTLGSYFLLKENQETMFLKAQKVRRLITNAFNRIYAENDLLIFPATTIAPLLTQNEEEDNWYSSYLAHANLAGTPSISLPWIKENNMPVNLSLDSKLYSDDNLLSYALYVEKMLGGNND